MYVISGEMRFQHFPNKLYIMGAQLQGHLFLFSSLTGHRWEGRIWDLERIWIWTKNSEPDGCSPLTPTQCYSILYMKSMSRYCILGNVVCWYLLALAWRCGRQVYGSYCVEGWVSIFMTRVFAIGYYLLSVINIHEQAFTIGSLRSTDLLNIYKRRPLT